MADVSPDVDVCMMATDAAAEGSGSGTGDDMSAQNEINRNIDAETEGHVLRMQDIEGAQRGTAGGQEGTVRSGSRFSSIEDADTEGHIRFRE